MAGSRKFLVNYGILASGDLISRLLTFSIMVYLARTFGKEKFGALGIAVAFAAYFELIARQGLDTFAVRAAAREPSVIRKIAESVQGIRFAASLLAFLLLAPAVWLLLPYGETKFLTILYGLMFFSAAASPQWAFQAAGKMEFPALARVAATAVFAALVLVLMTPTRIAFVPVFQFCGEALAVLWLLSVFRSQYGLPRLHFHAAKWLVVLHESIPMGMEGAFGLMLFNFDMVMLGIWRPISEAGEYSAVCKLVNFLLAFVTLYSTTLLPVVSRTRGSPYALQRSSEGQFRYVLLLTVPLSAGTMVVAHDVVTLIYGKEFAVAARALQILIWMVPLAACSEVFRNAMLAHGHQRALMWTAGCAAAVNAGLNLILIPRFSYLGAAAAMICSECVILFLVSFQVSRTITWLPLARHLWRPVAASAVMLFFVTSFATAGVFTRIAVAIAVYLPSAWVLGAFSTVDRK